jgi:hypothetical protein
MFRAVIGSSSLSRAQASKNETGLDEEGQESEVLSWSALIASSAAATSARRPRPFTRSARFLTAPVAVT